MRSIISRAGIATLAVAVFACNEKAEDAAITSESRGDSSVAASSNVAAERDAALIRLIHVVPGQGTVDVYAGEQALLSQVDFKTVTPYKELGTNLPEFKLVVAGTTPDSALAENREVVIDGKYYTLIALPNEDGKGVTLRAFKDDIVPADASMGRVRVINAARNAGDVSVYVNDGKDPFFDEVDFNTEAGFKDVTPGMLTLVIRAKDSNKELVRVKDLDISAGKSLTVVLTNSKKTGSKIEAVTVVDAPAQ